MKIFFPESRLLSCLNGSVLPLVVFGRGPSCDIYSTKMEFLKNVRLPFEPTSYLVVSDYKLLVFNNVKNENCLVDFKKGTFSINRSPLGSSPKRPIGNSAVFEVDDGFLFFPHNTVIQNKTFFYSVSAGRFKRVDIDLPDLCFSFGSGENGVFFRKNTKGNVEVSSFKNTFKKRSFVSEMEISESAIAEYLDPIDDFDLWRQVVYLSIETNSMIIAHQDKPDMTAYVDFLRGKIEWRQDLVAMPRSGKIVLIKGDGTKKEVKTEGLLYKFSNEPVVCSSLLIGRDTCLDIYKTDNLALLSTTQKPGGGGIVLPNGHIAYQVEGGVRISDFPALPPLYEN